MNYIYDIVLNFNKELYEFFEWKDDDNLINIRKIPLIKINDDDFVSLLYNKIKIEKLVLDTFKKKFSLYSEEINGNVICIVTNSQRAMGVMFDQLGNLIGRSAMLLDEEEEVLEESENLEETKLLYEINKTQQVNIKLSRVEIEKKQYIENFLNAIDDIKILKYIYFDYFDREAEKEDIKKILLMELEKKWDNNLNRLYTLTQTLSNVK